MKKELKFNEDCDLSVACFLMCTGDSMEIDDTEVIVNNKETKTCNELYDLLIGKVARYYEIGDTAIVTLTDGQVYYLEA
ncbi:hypothetical protein [Clostridium paraputrificum]|uniref:hypothetical protein n=1 Tax=Clostridium paraputrificum TaxID=29363 RepID=UPI00374F0678